MIALNFCAIRMCFVAIALAAGTIGSMAQTSAAPAIEQRVDSSQAHQPGTTTASPTSPDPKRAVYSLDEDVISFVKAAVWTGGFFLTAFAVLSVAFFGFDVRAAHKSIRTATDDVKERIDALKKDHQEVQDLKDRLEKLGAALVEEYEKAKLAIPAQPTDSVSSTPPSSSSEASTSSEPERDVPEDWNQAQTKMAIVRGIISTSKFEWTSLSRLERLSGLPRAELLHLTEMDSMVRRSVGMDGKPIFKLKKAVFKFADPQEAASYLIDESVLVDHAARGKEPLKGPIFGN
jgi:hypothetical protein